MEKQQGQSTRRLVGGIMLIITALLVLLMYLSAQDYTNFNTVLVVWLTYTAIGIFYAVTFKRRPKKIVEIFVAFVGALALPFKTVFSAIFFVEMVVAAPLSSHGYKELRYVGDDIETPEQKKERIAKLQPKFAQMDKEADEAIKNLEAKDKQAHEEVDKLEKNNK